MAYIQKLLALTRMEFLFSFENCMYLVQGQMLLMEIDERMWQNWFRKSNWVLSKLIKRATFENKNSKNEIAEERKRWKKIRYQWLMLTITLKFTRKLLLLRRFRLGPIFYSIIFHNIFLGTCRENYFLNQIQIDDPLSMCCLFLFLPHRLRLTKRCLRSLSALFISSDENIFKK